MYISNLCSEVVTAFEHDDPRSMYQCVGRVLRACKSKSKSSVQKFARINDAFGQPAQSLSEEKYIFREHFSDVMGGTACSFESLVVADRKVSSERFDEVPPISLKGCIPTIGDLSLLYRSFREGKGFGEGRICTDVYKHFADTMSRLQFPLAVKTYVRIQPPLQWKGGMVCELFKNKGSPSLCAHYRDIMLADDSGKAIGKLIRKRLLPFAANLAKSTQFGGGLNGGETAFAHLYIRLVIDWAVNSSVSCSVLFLDVVTAFATMLRRIVFNYEDGDEAWLASLHQAGFTHADIQFMYNGIRNYNWVEEMSNHSNVQHDIFTATLDYKLSEQFFTNSWATQEYIPNAINITRGSSAGTPLADLIYSMAMSRVLTCLRSSIEQEGLSSCVPAHGHQHDVCDVSFVDDVAIPCLAAASEIVDKTARIANCAFAVFQIFGMVLNFRPGKSEAIVAFFGAGASLSKRHLNLVDNLIPIEAGDNTHLRVVPSYQHVGTCTAISMSMSEEVTKRTGMMRSECARLCKAILRVPEIPVPKKIRVVQTYVLTKGTFQCGTWPMLPDTQYKRFHSSILGIYRNACGNYYKSLRGGDIDVASLFNDDDIIYTHGFLCPRTILRMSRLLLFVRLVAKSPPLLLALALSQSELKRGWVASLIGDLRWLCGSTLFADHASWDLSTWVDHFKVSPQASAKQIKAYCKSPFANICVQWAVSPTLRAFSQPIQCTVCGKLSMSQQAHAVHLYSAHKVKCTFRLYVPQTHCMICLREFWTREGCLNHAKKSKVCRYNLLIRGPYLSQIESDSLDQACHERNRQLHASGRRRHATEKSSTRLPGPLEPILLLESQVSQHHPLGVGQRHH